MHKLFKEYGQIKDLRFVTDKQGNKRGHGERSRLQLLLKEAGAGDMRILDVNDLAVNTLAVNGALPLHVESKSVLHIQYRVKKCLVHFTKRLTRSPCFLRSRAGPWDQARAVLAPELRAGDRGTRRKLTQHP